jgi:hypothetical protein
MRKLFVILLIIFITSLTACKEQKSAINPEETLISTHNATPEIKKLNTQAPVANKISINFGGNWYSESYKRVKTKSKTDAFTGAKLELLIPENGGEGTIELIYVSEPPASRVANIKSKINFEPKSKGIFEFDDDSWGDQGKGTLELIDGNIVITIKLTTIVYDNWGIFSGNKTFSRNMPDTYFTYDEDDSKKIQETTPVSIQTHTVDFEVGKYKATFEIPITWDKKYNIQKDKNSSFFYYKSKTLGDFMLFEIIEIQDSMWKKIELEYQGESGNHYTFITNKGDTDFVYRTHVVEGDPIEDEFYTMQNDFIKNIYKSFAYTNK